MIKVIRKGQRREFVEYTCRTCHSVLAANMDSVEYENSYPDGRNYILCPVCANRITVNLADWDWIIPPVPEEKSTKKHKKATKYTDYSAWELPAGATTEEARRFYGDFD